MWRLVDFLDLGFGSSLLDRSVISRQSADSCQDRCPPALVQLVICLGPLASCFLGVGVVSGCNMSMNMSSARQATDVIDTVSGLDRRV